MELHWLASERRIEALDIMEAGILEAEIRQEAELHQETNLQQETEL